MVKAGAIFQASPRSDGQLSLTSDLLELPPSSLFAVLEPGGGGSSNYAGLLLWCLGIFAISLSMNVIFICVFCRKLLALA